MLRWYIVVALGVLASTSIQAQNTGNTGSALGTGSNVGTGGNTGGLAGQVNTTLLGSNIDLNFNSVFGSNATLANTNADPFSAYRPSGAVSGAGSALGNSFSGTGGGNAFAGGAGAAGNRTATGGGAAGALGGNRNALGGNATLGGNRNALGGNTFGGNRNAMGMMGGGGLFGGGSFLGGGMNQQQNAITMGYTVNFDGMKPAAQATNIQPAANADFQQRLVTAPGMQGASNLQVLVRGETAIIRGTVTTDHAKQLAAAMIRLEPGIYEVQNELTVKP